MSSGCKDSRGIKRGVCMACDECDQYEFISEKGPECAYCGCPPVKHRKSDDDSRFSVTNQKSENLKSTEEVEAPQKQIDARSINTEIIAEESCLDNTRMFESYDLSEIRLPSSLRNVSDLHLAGSSQDLPDLQVASSSQDSREFQLPEPLSGVSSKPSQNKHTCRLCEETVILDYLIPDQYRPQLTAAIAKGNVTDTQKSEIVRLVVANMIQHEKRQEFHALQVAVLLVRKYPFFKGLFGSEHAGAAKMIKDCLKRQMQKKKTDVVKETSKTDWIQEQCAIMKRELGKGSDANRNLLKETLRSTRDYRKKEAKTLSAFQMIRKYASLRIPDLLLWDFSDSFGIKIPTLRRNWLDALPKILSILPATSRLDPNGQTIHVLLNLPNLFKAGKPKVKSLLIIYPTGTAVSDTIPQSKESPFLTAIGNPKDDSLTLFCYVDGYAVFSVKAMEAVLLLISVYWIFGIKFQPAYKQEMLFISTCLFRAEATRLIGQDLPRALSVIKLLKKAKID